MKIRYLSLSIVLATVLCLVILTTVGAADKFKLAKGAKGAVCLTCHDTFKEKLDKPFVHTPLVNGQCTGCHSPHTSDHGMLLDAGPEGICYTCHERLVPENARSSHAVVVEGKCNLCHDPHAAEHKKNLVRGGSDLCFECHGELGKSVTSSKFPHAPVKKNCLTCHDPHASAENPDLLSRQAPELCASCHKTGQKTFQNIHAGYPVQDANCVSCHNPHGSNTRSMLFDNVHEPVGKGQCKLCHTAGAQDPFALNKEGSQLCQGCHYEMVNDTFNKDRVHWPLLDKTGCLNCHAPHASTEPALLQGTMLETCGNCHADTIARQERSLTKHEPIAEGECSTCHSPHSSNNVFALNQASTIDLCADCHEWQNHSTHPIGADVVDPRNPNATLSCLSCHRTHGTEYKKFLYFETTNDLCVQCHTQYRR